MNDRVLQKIQEAEENQLEELDLSNDWKTPDEDKLTEIPEEVFKLKNLKVLKLRYNKISNLPESLGNLTSLTELDLSENQLTSLPESLGNLTSLTELDLSENQLTSLPESLGNLTSLTELHLTFNSLSSLPESLGNLTSLNKLSLAWNQLSSLPESLGNLTSLTELYLGRNRLTSLPESLGNLTSLTELYLGRNQLTSLPESLGNLTSLNTLDLSENQLTSLPESLGNLTSLNKLYLGRNRLTSLPESLGSLTSLDELSLAWNQLSSLPEFLGNLTNLIKLDLEGSQLTNLPEFLGNLNCLIRLYLGRNQLTGLPEFLSNLNHLPEFLGNLNCLIRLYSGRNQLKSLPEFLDNLTSLNELNLAWNRLKSLPEFLGNLTNLNELNLAGNQLKSLPEFLDNLTSLNELNLAGNQLKSLPESLGNLTSLNKLNLRGNQLKSLPEFLGNLTSLNKLNLRGNQLKSLPESLGNLTNLNELDLGRNQLKSLPESLGNLTNLNELDLGRNQLKSLPESLGNLTSLNLLLLYDNPLQKPPLEIATKGVQAIRKYFEQLRKEGEDYIYEAKLLIVGEAGAGKTTLAKKIQDPQYQLQESEPTTEGIDVIKWSFPLPDKEREFKVNIWDFGGQEIYYATHQFFLTKRSLYSLVADTRKDDTDFYYWLNIVELLSENSPLLIIKNEKQDRTREINERALKEQFDNLKKTLATNLADNRGLEDIITNIKHYIANLPHIGQTLPKTWVKVRQALKNYSRNYISLKEYLDICETNGFKKIEDKLQLSGYLHDLGVCLHFQDEEDSLLYKTVILKPEWGTDAVYKVLDNPQVINNQGHFTRNDLKNIWQDEKYASMRGELLELMKKFQLCYEVPESKDMLIAPQLLSDNQPEYDWDKSHNLILRYAYPDFMPKGIITRFIVIMHQYIDQQKYVWKTGVILKKDNTKAEVIENYGKREIRICVVGNNKRNFLTIVSHEIDKINDSYKRLKYQKLIPCNCDACKNSQAPFAYDFDKLLERASNSKLTIECGNSPYHEVQVLGLIDNAIDLEQLIDKNEQINIDRYQTRLEDRDKEINRLSLLVKQMSERQKVQQIFYGEVEVATGNVERDQNIKENTYNQSGNIGIGHNEGTISGNAKIAGVMNEAVQQDLAEAALEIQQLLDQLSKTYPTKTLAQKGAVADKTIEEIKNNPALLKKVTQAIDASGINKLAEVVDRPIFNLAKDDIEVALESEF
ncbi:MAG: COR domain-containing protein [Xenococcus sp. MO_188.B8]|nr:COR domain-containing protein [Xenococcus sp. MO_188.B8]